MKRLLCALVALLTLLCGCSAPAEPAPATPEPDPAMQLSDSTLTRREDVDTLLICAVGYDGAGNSQLTSLSLLVRDPSGAIAMLTLPKDTRVWVEHYDANGDYAYCDLGPLSDVYHAAEPADLAELKTVEAVSRLLGSVRIDHYAFLNVVQLRDLAALTDGVYVVVEDAIIDYSISAGYQNIVPNIENYAAYSYLNNIGGVNYPGTDPYKLQRHQQLIAALMNTLAEQMAELEDADRDDFAGEILRTLRTSLAARDVRSWLESGSVRITEAEILSGRQDERLTESYWIADTAAILDWATAHFYQSETE
ncbi:MAG: LCP family protein [Candidatus Spyradocola sp.]